MIKPMVVTSVSILLSMVVSGVVGSGACTSAQAQEELVYQWFKVTDHATFPARDGAGGLVYNDKMWILGGWNPPDTVNYPLKCSNDVWNSTDGETWTLVKPNTFDSGYDPLTDWEGRHTAGYVVHDDKMWIVGGDPLQGHYQDDVWSSSDGVTWTHVNQGNPVPWGPRILHYTTVFDNKIWVMGGQTTPQFAPGPDVLYNDVWNSSDGVNWTQVTPSAPWSPRGMIQGSVVFNGRMWLLGGGTYDTPTYPTRTFYNEVWSTADGVNWQMDTTAPWDPRQYHSVAVFDNKMWVMAGGNTSTPGFNRNDVWHSEDGVNWTQVPNTPWPTRHAGTAMVYDDALWMVAGSHPGSTPINDVWKLILTEPPPPVTPELVLNWDMDTLNGSKVADLTGNGNDGTPEIVSGTLTRFETGGPFAASPAYYDFNPQGTTLGVRINGGSDASMDVQTGDYSVSVWFKDFGSSPFGELVSRYVVSTDGAYYIAYDGAGGVSMFHRPPGGDYNYATTPVTGDPSEWHHAVGIFKEGVGTTVWVDGVAGTTDGTITYPIGPITDPFLAGAEANVSGNRFPFKGGIDEIKLFNYALSETEILALMQTNSATPLGGDFDLDGTVDVTDLGILATNYGTPSGAGWSMGDANFDGAVNVTDLGILATNYGTVTDAGSVPEPSTGLLIIVGLMTLGLRGRRR